SRISRYPPSPWPAAATASRSHLPFVSVSSVRESLTVTTAMETGPRPSAARWWLSLLSLLISIHRSKESAAALRGVLQAVPCARSRASKVCTCSTAHPPNTPPSPALPQEEPNARDHLRRAQEVRA